MSFTRAELFWCAYLWLAHQWHLEQLRELWRALDAGALKVGLALNRLMFGRRPIMQGLIPAEG